MSTNNTHQIRPRFQLSNPKPAEELMSLLVDRIPNTTATIHGSTVGFHASIKLSEQEQEFWSPQLDIEIEEAEKGSVIKGLFGPRPNLWLLYMFLYLCCGFVLIFSLIAGFSQLSMENTPIGFYAAAPCVLIAIGLRVSAIYGQKKMKHQIEHLYNFLLEITT